MHIVIRGIIVFFGLGILFLGLVFLIAGGQDNVQVGAVMVVVSMLLLLMAFFVGKRDAGDALPSNQPYAPVPPSEPTGMTAEPGLVCPYCGAPVDKADVKPKEGGLVLNCSNCHQVSQVEEGVRW